MKPIHKKRIKMWVNSLMRAKKQTKGTLRDSNGRCCLGVACDVFKRNNKKVKWKKPYEEYVFLGEVCGLPERVYRWFGLDGKYPVLNYDGCQVGAERLNDEYGLTFKQIAECVKKTFLEETKDEEDTQTENPGLGQQINESQETNHKKT